MSMWQFTEKTRIGTTLPPASDGAPGEWFFNLSNQNYYWHDGTQWNPLITPPPIQYYETYDDVRADTPLAPVIIVGGNNAVGDGGEGFFAKDNTFPLGDNDGTVLEDASGNKWVRIFGDTASAKWFIPKGSTVQIGSATANNLYNLIEQYHGHRRIEWSDITLTTGGVVTEPNVVVRSKVLVTASSGSTNCTSSQPAIFESCTFEPDTPATHLFINFWFSDPVFHLGNTNDSTTRIYRFINSNVYGAKFVGADNATPTGTANYGWWVASFENSSRANNCEFKNVALRATNNSIIGNSTHILERSDASPGGWTTYIQATGGSIINSVVARWNTQGWNINGLDVADSSIVDSVVLSEVKYPGTGGYPFPIQTIRTGIVRGNYVHVKRLDTGPSAAFSGLYFNFNFASDGRTATNNHVIVENTNGAAYGVVIGASNTATPIRGRLLLANNVFENRGPQAGTSGVRIDYSASSVQIVNNQFIGFENGITKNGTFAQVDITGFGNRFVNVVNNIPHPDYVNTTDDRTW